jgi:hypothetical protein
MRLRVEELVGNTETKLVLGTCGDGDQSRGGGAAAAGSTRSSQEVSVPRVIPVSLRHRRQLNVEAAPLPLRGCPRGLVAPVGSSVGLWRGRGTSGGCTGRLGPPGLLQSVVSPARTSLSFVGGAGRRGVGLTRGGSPTGSGQMPSIGMSDPFVSPPAVAFMKRTSTRQTSVVHVPSSVHGVPLRIGAA